MRLPIIKYDMQISQKNYVYKLLFQILLLVIIFLIDLSFSELGELKVEIVGDSLKYGFLVHLRIVLQLLLGGDARELIAACQER